MYTLGKSSFSFGSVLAKQHKLKYSSIKTRSLKYLTTGLILSILGDHKFCFKLPTPKPKMSIVLNLLSSTNFKDLLVF